MNKIKVYNILLLILVPVLLFSQVRISGTSEIRVLEEGEIRVAGNVNLEDATSSVSLDGNMSISGGLTNSANASNFIIESDASNTGSLIVEGAIIGDYRVERYLTPSTWHFLSASVDGLTTNSFYFNDNPLTWISEYNEPAGTWDFIPGQNESLQLGAGYKFWVAGETPITAYMEGGLKSTSLSVDLDFGGVGGNWNLIGNPFPSAIDLDDANWGSNTTGSVYVWDSTYNDGDYRVYNGSVGDLTNGVIPISQSFFINATSANPFNIPLSARTHENYNFYKSTHENEKPFIRLQLDHQTKGNTLFIGFPDNGTAHFDYRGDAHKLYSAAGVPQLFAMEDGEKLCINANKPLGNEMISIPLYIDQVENGEYSLSMSKGENLPGVQMVLKDLKTGYQQDLKKFPTYNYSASENDDLQRFVITFHQNAYGFEEEESIGNLVEMYYANDAICITSKGGAEFESGDLHIFNLLGQEIHSQKIAAGELIRIPFRSDQRYIIAQLVKNDVYKVEKIKL